MNVVFAVVSRTRMESSVPIQSSLVLYSTYTQPLPGFRLLQIPLKAVEQPVQSPHLRCESW